MSTQITEQNLLLMRKFIVDTLRGEIDKLRAKVEKLEDKIEVMEKRTNQKSK